ncbi:HesA/MoeB/ThiF family protein [Listeria monocytogenes]
MDEIGKAGQQKIEDTTIAIIGCGGLGSANIYNLAALGIKKIILIDNDKVELSNLNRQYIHNHDDLGKFKAQSAQEKVNKLNNNVETVISCKRLDESNIVELLSDADIIIDAVDNIETRYLLDEYCTKYDKPVFFGAVEGFYGTIYARLSTKMKPYSAIFNKTKAAKREIGVVGAAVSVISSIQCTEVLKYIVLERKENSMLLHIDLLNNRIERLKV